MKKILQWNFLQTKLLFVILASFLFCFSSEVKASHYRYGNITWSRTTDLSTNRTVTIKVNQAWRRSFFGAVSVGATVNNTSSLNFGDGTSTPINIVVTSVNVTDDWFYGTFTVTKTYGGTSTNFTASYLSNARIGSPLQNNANGIFGSKTVINLVTGNTGSPISTMPPIINLPTNQTGATFTIPAADPDNSTLTFSLATAADMSNGSGWTQASGFSVSSGGTGTFNTVGKAVGNYYNVGVKVTDASGSTTLVDFLIFIVAANTPPVFDYLVTPADGAVFNLNPGQSLGFTVKALDVDVGSTVVISAVGLPTSNISFSPALPTGAANPVSTVMTFNPTTANLGVYVVTFTAMRNGGVSTNTTVKINVNVNPQFISPTKLEGITYVIPTSVAHKDTIVAENPDPAVNTQMLSATIPSTASLSASLPTSFVSKPTVVMSWTPTPAEFGPHNVSFTAKDANARTVTRNYILVANTVPYFTSTPVTVAQENVFYSYNIKYVDSNYGYGDILQITHMGLPSWLSLTDNGDGTGTLSGTPGSTDTGVFEIELEAADLYHHTHNHVHQEFEIYVCTAPSFTTCPSNINENSSSNSCGATVNYSSVVAGTFPTVTYSFSGATSGNGNGDGSGSTFNLGVTNVTITANNNCGNAVCSFTVTVTDNVRPEIICPSDITQSNDAGVCKATVNVPAPKVTDNCTGSFSAASEMVANGNFSAGATSWDACGNSVEAYCNETCYGGPDGSNSVAEIDPGYLYNTTVEDQVLCQSIGGFTVGKVYKLTFLASRRDYYSTPNPVSVFLAIDGGALNTIVSRSNSSFSWSTSTYTFTATQTTHLLSFKPTSQWGVGLGLIVDDLSIKEAVGAVVNDYNSTSNASGTYPVGTTTVRWIATDASGNSDTCFQNITIEDNEKPTVNTQNVTVYLDANGAASIGTGDINDGSTDNCGIDKYELDITDFDCSNVGDNTVTLTVTDVNGNSDSKQATVTVKDNMKPTVNTQDVTVYLDANGSASIGTGDINNGSTDNCGIDKYELDITDFDCSNVGDNTVTLTVTDVNGNSDSKQATVTVKEIIKPTVNTQNVTVYLDANGAASTTAADINDGSTDNCAIDKYELDVTDFDCSNVGDNTVTLTVTDVNGNSDSKQATVTVKDIVKPTVLVKNASKTLLGGTASITVADINDGSFDNCSIKTYSLDKTDFDCSNIGDNTVTLTITDINGNVDSKVATVTINGTIPTVSIAQSQQPVFCQGGNIILSTTASETVTYLWNTTETSANINVHSSGTFSVTVTNGNGCTGSASSTVTYSQTTMLSSYTILVKEEAEIEKTSTVASGGVGSTGCKGEIEVKDKSSISGTYTFAQAKDVDVESGSTVTNNYGGSAAVVTLPAFLANPKCKQNDDRDHDDDNDEYCWEHKHNCKNKNSCSKSSKNYGKDVKVKKNTRVTLTDSVYRKIQIESGAKVTFTSSVIYADKIETAKNDTLIFSGCTNISLCDEMKIDEYNVVNAENRSIVFYVNDKVDVKKGTKFIGSIYTKDKLDTKGDKNSRISMTGMFIAEKVHAHYADYNWGTACGSCNNRRSNAKSNVASAIRDASTDYVNVYPNPTLNSTNVTVNANTNGKGELKINLMSITGTTLSTIVKADFTGLADVPVDMSNVTPGIYLIKVQYGETVKLFKVQKLD